MSSGGGGTVEAEAVALELVAVSIIVAKLWLATKIVLDTGDGHEIVLLMARGLYGASTATGCSPWTEGRSMPRRSRGRRRAGGACTLGMMGAGVASVQLRGLGARCDVFILRFS